MVRKFASFAFALSLLLAIGFAMPHAHPPKAPAGSIGFSTPCLPASPTLQATSEAKVVSTIDSTFAAGNAETPGCVVSAWRVEAVSRTIPPPAPRACYPLWHRPPPANS